MYLPLRGTYMYIRVYIQYVCTMYVEFLFIDVFWYQCNLHHGNSHIHMTEGFPPPVVAILCSLLSWSRLATSGNRRQPATTSPLVEWRDPTSSSELSPPSEVVSSSSLLTTSLQFPWTALYWLQQRKEGGREGGREKGGGEGEGERERGRGRGGEGEKEGEGEGSAPEISGILLIAV